MEKVEKNIGNKEGVNYQEMNIKKVLCVKRKSEEYINLKLNQHTQNEYEIDRKKVNIKLMAKRFAFFFVFVSN